MTDREWIINGFKNCADPVAQLKITCELFPDYTEDEIKDIASEYLGEKRNFSRRLTNHPLKEYPTEMVEKAYELAQEGYTIYAASQIMGVSYGMVKNIAKRHFIDFPKYKNRKLTAKEVEETRRLASEGKSVDEIAKALGISNATVLYRGEKYSIAFKGIKKRHRTTKTEKSEVVQMAKNGVTCAEISRITGLGYMVVHSIIRHYLDEQSKKERAKEDGVCL